MNKYKYIHGVYGVSVLYRILIHSHMLAYMYMHTQAYYRL